MPVMTFEHVTRASRDIMQSLLQIRPKFSLTDFLIKVHAGIEWLSSFHQIAGLSDINNTTNNYRTFEIQYLHVLSKTPSLGDFIDIYNISI